MPGSTSKCSKFLNFMILSYWLLAFSSYLRVGISLLGRIASTLEGEKKIKFILT